MASGYTYTVHRGDTLESVARRSGVNVKALCDVNGLNQKAGVKPGQRIKLVNGKSPASSDDLARPGVVKSGPAAVVAPKASGSFVPAVYTADRHGSLSKTAQQQGLDPKALCQINGMNQGIGLKPGQKARLLEAKSTQKSSGTQKAQVGKSDSKSSTSQLAKVEKTPKKNSKK